MVGRQGLLGIEITYICRRQGILFLVGQPQFIASFGVRYRPESRNFLHKDRRSRQGLAPVAGYRAGYSALCRSIDRKEQTEQ